MNSIPVSRPYFWGGEIANVNEALKDLRISSQGPFLEAFEAKFATTTNSQYAIAVSNGTVALHLACDVIGLRSNDEVIVADFSMIAPLFALSYLGCIPVPVDIDDSWNLDPALIEASITDKTKAILVVHNYGHPADMTAIMEIAKRYHLRVIEDVAEAIGASRDGKMTGSWGDISCYSLYANKIITTGEGGMITTNDKSLYQAAQSKRNMSFGITPDRRFLHEEIGYNYRLTNLQAAIGCAQIDHLEDSIACKINIAKKYISLLKDVHGISLPPSMNGTKNVYWVFGILIEEEFGASKSELQHSLARKGIETRSFFSPVHEQPFLKSIEFPKGKYRKSRELSKKGIYLPSYVGLKNEDMERVVDAIAEIQLTSVK